MSTARRNFSNNEEGASRWEAASDSEAITIALVSECRCWGTDTELPDNRTPYLALFPHFPERSRFNRRRRNPAQAISILRRMVLQERLPKALTHVINQVRQLIETVTAQLTDQFNSSR